MKRTPKYTEIHSISQKFNVDALSSVFLFSIKGNVQKQSEVFFTLCHHVIHVSDPERDPVRCFTRSFKTKSVMVEERNIKSSLPVPHPPTWPFISWSSSTGPANPPITPWLTDVVQFLRSGEVVV